MRVDADALISRFLQGDTASFERLYDHYAARLVGFLRSLGASREAAEDLAQRAWLKALEALGNYRPEGRFRPWLFRIAHHLWLDEVRSGRERGRGAMAPGPDAEGAPQRQGEPVDERTESPRDAAIAHEERGLVENALHELPDEMRRTVLLRIDANLTFREIAEEMDCSLGTALWRMQEAEKRLRRMLNP